MAGLYDQIIGFLRSTSIPVMVKNIQMFNRLIPGWGNLDRLLIERADELVDSLIAANATEVEDIAGAMQDLGFTMTPDMRARAKDGLIKRMKDEINGRSDPRNMQGILAALKFIKVNLKVGETYKAKMLAAIARHVAERGYDPTIGALTKLMVKMGVGDPQAVAKIIEDNKPSVMRSLLTLIKGGQGESALTRIKDLEDLGVRWDEFEIIRRSAAVNEAREPTDPKLLRAYFTLEEKLMEEDFEYLSSLLSDIGKSTGSLGFHGININGYKEEILRDMLFSIKHYEDDMEINMDDDDLLYMIKGARKMGADWAELDVIEKSLREGITDEVK